MTIKNLKISLQVSLKKFIVCMAFISVFSFLSIYFNFDKWVLGFTPTIIFFCLIGSVLISKTIVFLSSIEGELEKADENAINEKFVGISGVQWLFYILVVFSYGVIFMLCGFYGINLWDWKIIHPIISLLLFIGTLLTVYFTLETLSFSIFFVSIIYGWTNSVKVRKVKDEIQNKRIAEDYDIDKNIKKLIEKYIDRIVWLENHISDENQSEYKSKIAAYQVIINDLKDFLYGIDI